MQKLSDLTLTPGAHVIVRAGLNVPVSNGAVTDEYRIDTVLPTLKYLLDAQASIVIISHMGRPDGKHEPELSLKPVAETLSAKLNHHVELVENFRTTAMTERIRNAKPGEIFLLENIRFYSEEEAHDDATRRMFAQELKELGDVYINEAFPDYRKAASTYDLPILMSKKAIGIRFAEELATLDKTLNEPEHPFVAVIGGAKLSTKFPPLKAIADKADKVLIGGAMAYTFLKAMGHETGDSLVEDEQLDAAKELIKHYSGKLELPVDHVVADEFNENSEPQHVEGTDIPPGKWGLDIGPQTIEKYQQVVQTAKHILWNGPLGVFEWDKFSQGTRQVGIAIADQAAYTLVGGGDTINAIEDFELDHGVDYISTGGGAMLEYIASGTLPSLAALE